jgi:hypothetical protein
MTRTQEIAEPHDTLEQRRQYGLFVQAARGLRTWTDE